jgi:hypothetical protein
MLRTLSLSKLTRKRSGSKRKEVLRVEMMIVTAMLTKKATRNNLETTRRNSLSVQLQKLPTSFASAGALLVLV